MAKKAFKDIDIKRLLQLGFLKSEQAASNPSAVKSAQTKYEKSISSNKAVKERETISKSGDFETVFTPSEFDRKIISPESLQGRPLIPLQGDVSGLGLLSKVGGLPVNVKAQAGPRFTQEYAPINLGWASNQGAAQAYLNKVDNVAQLTGQNPISISSAMAMDSMKSPKFVTRSLFQQLSQTPIAKRDIKEFDSEFRKLNPNFDWAGLDNGGFEQLLDAPGSVRSSFVGLISKAKYRDKGFPLADETMRALVDPRLRDANLGDSGASIMTLDPSKGLIKLDPSVHETYPYGMQLAKNEYQGNLERLVPFRVAFPDIYKKQTTKLDKSGRPQSIPNAINSGSWSADSYQMANQEWLDNIMGYLQAKKGQKGLLGAAAPVGAANKSLFERVESPVDVGPAMLEAAYNFFRGKLKGKADDLGSLSSGGPATVSRFILNQLKGANPKLTGEMIDGLLPMIKDGYLDEKEKKMLETIGQNL